MYPRLVTKRPVSTCQKPPAAWAWSWFAIMVKISRCPPQSRTVYRLPRSSPPRNSPRKTTLFFRSRKYPPQEPVPPKWGRSLARRRNPLFILMPPPFTCPFCAKAERRVPLLIKGYAALLWFSTGCADGMQSNPALSFPLPGEAVLGLGQLQIAVIGGDGLHQLLGAVQGIKGNLHPPPHR